MTKKTQKKTVKKSVKKEKVLKVEVVQPEVEISPETYKEEPIKEETTYLPVEQIPKPAVNPNNPKMVGIKEGFKKPSITDMKSVHTKKQFKTLVENWLKENESLQETNPAKWKKKKSELAAKLERIK